MSDKEYRDITELIDIFCKLSDVGKAMLIGTGNGILLASAQNGAASS